MNEETLCLLEFCFGKDIGQVHVTTFVGSATSVDGYSDYCNDEYLLTYTSMLHIDVRDMDMEWNMHTRLVTCAVVLLWS